MSPRGLYYLLGLVLIVPDAVADAKFGEDCSSTNPGYACDLNRRLCLATPGTGCGTTFDCVNRASCLNNTCYCDSGYRPYSPGLCEKDDGLRLLGEPCSLIWPCNHDGINCSATLTCYVCDRVTDRCATKVGTSCVTSTECVSHSTCDVVYGCLCDSGYTYNEAGLCGADTGGSLGAYCFNQTTCFTGYVCVENTCYAGVGTACSDSLQCAKGRCDSEQKKCLLPQYNRCETSASCVSNAMCTNHGHCMCNSGYTPNEIGLCTVTNQTTTAQATTTPTTTTTTPTTTTPTTTTPTTTTPTTTTPTTTTTTTTPTTTTTSQTTTTQTTTTPTTSPASVGNSTHAVEGTTIGNTLPGQRNKGLRLTMVWIPNVLFLMTGVLLVGL